MSMRKGSSISVVGFFHHSADPTNVVGQSRIDPELSEFPASLAEAGDAKNGPGMIGSPRVPTE